MEFYIPWLLWTSIFLQETFGFTALQREKVNTAAAKKVYEGQCDFPFVAVDGGFCYFMSKSLLAMTWEEAQTMCGWMHPQGHLAEFNTSEELVQATFFLLDNDPSCNSWSARGPWIGAREIGNSNKFVWVSTNTPIANDNWASGQPNSNTSGDSVVLDCEHNYEWADMEATSDVPVLCEVPANPPAEVLVCPSDFTLVDSRCYHIGQEGRTFDQSLEYCAVAAPSENDPKLAEFETLDELQTCITEYLLTVCHPPECVRCFWIGGEEHRWKDEKFPSFIWVSSATPIVYNAWAPNRPIDPENGAGFGIEICSYIMWNFIDNPKSEVRPLVCEAEPSLIGKALKLDK